ncbi:MAG: trypsin-like peptidase domain-containing protein [Microcoleaceae cyanobacterium MO_207.B10]|nr:trypsin-like peptidase domain-containing protein [Microcoleaceae cyanobacterium MO_207.B10]
MINLKKFKESIVLISSTKKANVIGTGFPFYREQNYTYLLTCAHVVEDMGDEENIRVNNIPVEVVAVGNVKGFDLAVLRVKQLLPIPILRLMILDEEEERSFEIKIPGYYLWSQNNARRRRTIKGIMTVEVDGERAFQIIENLPEEVAVGKLKIEKGELQSGYSGAPIIDLETGLVVGVTTHKNYKEGKFGTAISIAALEKIWREIPTEVSQEIIGEPLDIYEDLPVEENRVELVQNSDNLSAEKTQVGLVENSDNLSARLDKIIMTQFDKKFKTTSEYCASIGEKIILPKAGEEHLNNKFITPIAKSAQYIAEIYRFQRWEALARFMQSIFNQMHIDEAERTLEASKNDFDYVLKVLDSPLREGISYYSKLSGISKATGHRMFKALKELELVETEHLYGHTKLYILCWWKLDSFLAKIPTI